MAGVFLAVYFLVICFHEVYIAGGFDERRHCSYRPCDKIPPYPFVTVAMSCVTSPISILPFCVALALSPSVLYLKEGDKFDLQCNYSGTGVDVRWELDGKEINPQSLGFEVSSRSAAITANFTASQHEGSYRCSATPPPGGHLLSCPSVVRKAGESVPFRPLSHKVV